MTETITKPKAPTIPCEWCAGTDWAYNSDMQKWNCVKCAMNGRPSPPEPSMAPETIADDWCDAALFDYDVAMGELENVKLLPKTGEVSAIIQQASMKRAEKRMKKAEVKAEVADMILGLRSICQNGDVYFDLPQADIKVRIKW